MISGHYVCSKQTLFCLTRTFYGTETSERIAYALGHEVILLVPFESHSWNFIQHFRFERPCGKFSAFTSFSVEFILLNSLRYFCWFTSPCYYTREGHKVVSFTIVYGYGVAYKLDRLFYFNQEILCMATFYSWLDPCHLMFGIALIRFRSASSRQTS